MRNSSMLKECNALQNVNEIENATNDEKGASEPKQKEIKRTKVEPYKGVQVTLVR